MHVDEAQALRDLVARGIKIPPQPAVLVALQRELAGGDYDVRSVARIINQDPAIVAMLFRAARSPVFSRNRKFDSVEQVLMVIGVMQTVNLVQAVALATAVSGAARKGLDVFWTRSQEVARLAALVAADRVSVCNVFPDQAYMAGIFHECGVPVLMVHRPDYCQSLRLDRACCWPSLAEEDARFDLDHCSVGYLVARHWGLPDFVCAAIRYHHEVPRDELGAARTLVAILQMGIHCYHRMSHVDDALWPQIRADVLCELGLADDEEDDFCGRMIEAFHQAA